jgi:hypothetical protein
MTSDTVPALQVVGPGPAARPARSRIPELRSIEFKGAKSVAAYSRALRDLNRSVAIECEAAADEFVAVVSRQRHPGLAGVNMRRRARKVAKRLHRAAELAAGAAVEAVKLNAEFRVQFAEALTPANRPRRRNQFDFNDH